MTESCKSMKPSISICVTTYNYARFLPDCVESVLQQTFADWELIVCDDCSTDETQHLMEQYVDPRIRHVRNSERLGMSANLKLAADLGRGRYLKILCADDWIAPRCLERMFELMEANPKVVLGTSAEIATNAVGRPFAVQFLFGRPLSVIPGQKMLDRMAHGHGFGGNSSFFVQASAHRAVGGYDPNLLYAGDYDLGARLCQVGNYLHTDEPLFYGRHHSASSSSVNPARLYDVKDYFFIPAKVFQPRPFGSRNWFRFQWLTGALTSRCLTNMALRWLRGHRSYASGLARILRDKGNFPLGLLLLPFHCLRRLFNRMTGRHLPRRSAPDPWMGRPQTGPATIWYEA